MREQAFGIQLIIFNLDFLNSSICSWQIYRAIPARISLGLPPAVVQQSYHFSGHQWCCTSNRALLKGAPLMERDSQRGRKRERSKNYNCNCFRELVKLTTLLRYSIVSPGPNPRNGLQACIYMLVNTSRFESHFKSQLTTNSIS